MRLGGRKSIIVGVLAMLLCVSLPIGAIVLAFTWEDMRLDITMPRYPGMQQLGYTQGYYGANSGTKSIYFWTEDSIDQVQQFYERFSLPFERRGGFQVTVFNPYADEIPLTYNVNGSRFDTSQDRDCHYTQRYDCVRVSLRTFSSRGSVFLPRPSLDSRIIKTPVPANVPDPVSNGTLIMVEFYMHDF